MARKLTLTLHVTLETEDGEPRALPGTFDFDPSTGEVAPSAYDDVAAALNTQRTDWCVTGARVRIGAVDGIPVQVESIDGIPAEPA